MGALSLVTKGMLCRRQIDVVMQSGSGGAGLKREEELPKPLIKVLDFTISEARRKVTGETLKVKSVKLVID